VNFRLSSMLTNRDGIVERQIEGDVPHARREGGSVPHVHIAEEIRHQGRTGFCSCFRAFLRPTARSPGRASRLASARGRMQFLGPNPPCGRAELPLSPIYGLIEITVPGPTEALIRNQARRTRQSGSARPQSPRFGPPAAPVSPCLGSAHARSNSR
jgi:hypothetical protein